MIKRILLTVFLLLSCTAAHAEEYEDTLFDRSKVHTIDISMKDWDSFVETCEDEQYAECDVTIDGERIANVGIRAKGNTSLSSVAMSGSSRYSFKIEFDHYQKGRSYHGLDKLCLNNLIQDKTWMKDDLAYMLMNRMGVAAPLSSYVQISVNGEPWGLYLAVEAVEDSFLSRNHMTGGELYKPDNLSMDGGAPMGGMGASDVKLQYIDDDPDSYASIFSSAKTEVTQADEKRLIASLKALSEGQAIESVVDTDAVLRYLVVHSFLCNDDSYTGMMVHNYYLYEKAGRMSLIPWDYNLAMGGFSMGASSDASSVVNAPIDSPVSQGDVSSRPMVAWIFQSEAYMELYHLYCEQFLSVLTKDDWLHREIIRVRDMIAPYVQADESAFFSYDEFETAVDALLQFCDLRIQSISGQLAGNIPSTREGQRQNTEALVDAAEVSLSDLGEFGMGGGKGGPGGDFSQMPQDGSFSQTMEAGNFPQMPEGGFPPMEEAGAFDRGVFPGGMRQQEEVQPESTGAAIAWLGTSAAVLLAALWYAWKFRV